MTSPYGGGGTPKDLGRVPAKRAPRAYALATNDRWGFEPAYQSRPSRKRHPVTSNRPDPARMAELEACIAAMADDREPVRVTVPDYDAERHAAGTIRMGDMN